MSKENLEQFMSKVADSEELQAKIGEQIDAEALIALGAECGCEFTAEELQESAELSDEELDGVAGGALKRGERATLTSNGQGSDHYTQGIQGDQTSPAFSKRIKVNFAGWVGEDDLV